MPEPFTKETVIAVGAPIITWQVPVPLQAPDHPEKEEPESGVAVSVTDEPARKVAVQVLPQSIPWGTLVTVPVPPPSFTTERL